MKSVLSEYSEAMPSVVPRLFDPEALGDDPLAFLADARRKFGDAIIIVEDAPLFSPAGDCPGVVALFGSKYHRQVLRNPRSFASTGSAGRALGLPENIINLNRSLHSMEGRQHEAHKAILAGVTTPALLVRQRASIVAAIDTFATAWREATSIPIFAALQGLLAEIAATLLFGETHPARRELQSMLVQYFDARRQPLSARHTESEVAKRGTALDAALNLAISAPDGGNGLPPRLAAELGDVAVRAHLNVLFMSIVEPVAVATTWLLLILSQLPELRHVLRSAYLSKTPNSILPTVLEYSILEALRLLSPNAVMVRVTSRPVVFADALFPRGCEIILVPFLAHRDPAIFPQPALFKLERWSSIAPSVFDYLPFGAGIHACIGKRLAVSLIGTIVGELLSKVDPILSFEQIVDWRIDITLRPRFDIHMTAASLHSYDVNSIIRWHGPVAQLIEFD